MPLNPVIGACSPVRPDVQLRFSDGEVVGRALITKRFVGPPGFAHGGITAMLGELARRYDRKEISTEEFRNLAASFLPPKADDPKLETFFGQWVYGTGIPTVKMSYSVKGAAPNVKVTGIVTQSGVDDEFTALAPVEIQIGRGKTVTLWVRTSDTPATFSMVLKAPPLKVTLDPHHALLRK